jgi:excisionase family DNA binding protein
MPPDLEVSMEPTTTPNPTTEFITLKEAATATRGSAKYLRQQIALGHLRAFRIGHKILIKSEDLNAFVATKAMVPAAEGGL